MKLLFLLIIITLSLARYTPGQEVVSDNNDYSETRRSEEEFIDAFFETTTEVSDPMTLFLIYATKVNILNHERVKLKNKILNLETLKSSNGELYYSEELPEDLDEQNFLLNQISELKEGRTLLNKLTRLRREILAEMVGLNDKNSFTEDNIFSTYIGSLEQP